MIMKIDEKEKCTEEIIMKKTDKNNQNMPQNMDQIIIPKKSLKFRGKIRLGSTYIHYYI